MSSSGQPRRYTIRKNTAPIIEIDCTGWGRVLEIGVSIDAQIDPSFPSKVSDLLRTVNQIDSKAGGFRLVQNKKVGENVVLTFAPIDSDHAATRIDDVIRSLSTAKDGSLTIAYAKAA